MKQDTFLEFEVKYKLFEQSFNNFFYWHYLRFEISLAVMGNESNESNKISAEKNSPISSSDIKKILRLALMNNAMMVKGHKDILALGFPRKISDNGVFVDPYVEYLLNNLPYSSLLLQKYQRAYSKSFVYDKNSIFIEDGILLSRIREHFILPSERTKITEAAEYIKASVYDYFGIEIDSDIIYRKLVKSYSIWCVFGRRFRKLIKKTTPKCVIETPGYSDQAQVLNEVANEFSIPSIEIEHGWIMPGNIPNNVSWDKPVASFPNYIFVYSDYQKKYVQFYQDESHVKVVGWPYFDERIKNRKAFPDSNIKTILILGNMAYLGGQIVDFACELSDYIKKNGLTNKYRIIYKSHPTDNCGGSKYDYLRSFPNVEIVSGASGRTVYDCIEVSSMAISSVTSTLYEAKGYGLEIFVLKTDEADMMRPLVEMGYAYFVSKPEDIFAEHNNQGLPSLWPINSLQLSTQEIDRIIKDNN